MTDYPPGFPLAAQLKVEKARDRQGKKLAYRIEKRMPSPSLPDRKVLYYSAPRQLGKHHWPGKPEDLLLIFIAAVWRVFVSENTKRQQWTRISDWEWQAMDLLRQLVSELYGESKFGWRHQSTVNPWDVDRTMNRVVKQIQGFKTWRYLRKEFAESAAKEARKRRQPKPAATGPAPEESGKTSDRLLYDEKTKTLKFGGMLFVGVNKHQAAAIECLYNLSQDSAGMPGENVMKAIGLPNNRFQNLFQRDHREILDALVDYDRHRELYSFKFPRHKPRQN